MPNHTQDLYRELKWLAKCTAQVTSAFKKPEPSDSTAVLPTPPGLNDTECVYSMFVNSNQLDVHERLLLILALAPHLSQQILHPLNLQGNPAFLHQFGGNGAFMPTGETFLFLASQGVEDRKLLFHSLLDTDHVFYKKSVIELRRREENLPPSYGLLLINRSFVDLFLYNRRSRPRFGPDFPAHLLETHLDWDDLVLNDNTRLRLGEVKTFIENEEKLRKDWNFGKHLKNGYRMLFHGPSGTGKTLAATLMGKLFGKDVFRVDLSAVVSKYIGETSKHLNSLFNTAEDKGWILFFDEGDALFGKRSDSGNDKHSNSQYANQDVAFLLQRIENFNGIVIVATNFKSNLDGAFVRRFQTIIPFDIPNEANRIRLWEENLPEACPVAAGVNIELLAKRHDLSAAAIIKIIHRAAVITLQKEQLEISLQTLDYCIRDEEYNQKM